MTPGSVLNDPLTLLTTTVALAVIELLVIAISTARLRRWRDPVRFFSWTDKQQLIRQAGGRCERKALFWRRCPATGTEADHVLPWSKGGRTVLANGQLLCHRHNQRKSNHMPGLLYLLRLKRRRRVIATPYPPTRTERSS